MKKVVAIIFSDLHINNWSKFNDKFERTLNNFKVLSIISDICRKYGCPSIFCGDLLHKPESIDLDLISILQKEFSKLPDNTKIYAISGNHDMNRSNNIDKRSNSWLKVFSKWYNFLECIDFKSIDTKYFKLFGIPYLDHNIGLNQYVKKLHGKLSSNKPNILILHTDYPGAKDTDNIEVGSVENLNINLLDKFDLVLIGHIHKPQRLSKKVYMVGAPLQQRRTDKDCKLGYWKLYSDMSLEFIPTNFPKFIDVDDESKVLDDGNYYTVIQKPKEDVQTNNNINRSLSKKKIISEYLKKSGIMDKNKKVVLMGIIKEAEKDD